MVAQAGPFLSFANPSESMLRHWEMCAKLDFKSSQVEDEDALSLAGSQEVDQKALTLPSICPSLGPHFQGMCYSWRGGVDYKANEMAPSS